MQKVLRRVWQYLVVRMCYDGEWELSGSDNQFPPSSWSITILCISLTARHTEHSSYRSFNESGSKNSHRMDIYFNICRDTVNDWEVKAQEKLQIIMFTNKNNRQYYHHVCCRACCVTDVVNNIPELSILYLVHVHDVITWDPMAVPGWHFAVSDYNIMNKFFFCRKELHSVRKVKGYIKWLWNQNLHQVTLKPKLLYLNVSYVFLKRTFH
jgi:hypothetical protein